MKTRYNVILLFIISVILSYTIRIQYMNTVLDLDEGTYLTVGMLFAKGKIPYQDVYESKPPLLHLLNAINYLIVGNDILLSRIIIIIIAAFTSVTLYLITKQAFDNRTAILASLFFTIFSSSPLLGGFKNLTEPYAVLFGWIALAFFFKAVKNKEEVKLYLISGFFIGCYIMIRLTGLLLILYLFLWLIITTKNWKKIKPMFWSFIGLGIIPLSFLTFFFIKGALPDLLYWLTEPVSGFKEYVVVTLHAKGLWFINVFTATAPLWFLSTIGIILRRDHISTMIFYWGNFLLATFFLSFLPAFPHYYYEILPILCILGSSGCFHIISLRKDNHLDSSKSRYSKPLIFTLILIIIIISTVISIDINVQLSQEYIQQNDLAVVKQISNYLNTHAQSAKEILIFETGWPKIGPYIYYASEIYPAMKNLFFFPWKISETQVTEIIKTIENNELQYVIFIGPEPVFPEVQVIYQKVDSEYDLVYNFRGNLKVYPHISEQIISIKIYEH